MMFKVAFDLIRLKAHPMLDYHWPFWHSVSLMTLIGILTGLDPHNVAMLTSPLRAIVFGVVIVWVTYPVIVVFMRWWFKRGSRWDGQGKLFNLIIAASVCDLLAAGLTMLGVPPLLTYPLWIYSIWVAANALGEGCNVSMSYAIVGIVLSMIPAMIIIGLVSASMFALYTAMGVMSPLTGVAP